MREGHTDERTDEQTDERKSPCVLQDFVPLGAAAQKVKFDRRTDRFMDGWMDEWTEEFSFRNTRTHITKVSEYYWTRI